MTQAGRGACLVVGAGDGLKWLYDLHLLMQALDAAQWRDFEDACRDARICGVALSAMDAATSAFGTPLPEDVRKALSASAGRDVVDAGRLQDWRHQQWQSLRALPDWRARLGWMHARGFPSLGYMRELYGRDLDWADLMKARLLRLFGRAGGRA